MLLGSGEKWWPLSHLNEKKSRKKLSRLFVALVADFGPNWKHDLARSCFILKKVFLGQEVHYYMVHIAYHELNLPFAIMRKSDANVKIPNTRLTKNFVAIFALAERLPASATLKWIYTLSRLSIENIMPATNLPQNHQKQLSFSTAWYLSSTEICVTVLRKYVVLRINAPAQHTLILYNARHCHRPTILISDLTNMTITCYCESSRLVYTKPLPKAQPHIVQSQCTSWLFVQKSHLSRRNTTFVTPWQLFNNLFGKKCILWQSVQ